jgi:hypothetical protein
MLQDPRALLPVRLRAIQPSQLSVHETVTVQGDSYMDSKLGGSSGAGVVAGGRGLAMNAIRSPATSGVECHHNHKQQGCLQCVDHTTNS